MLIPASPKSLRDTWPQGLAPIEHEQTGSYSSEGSRHNSYSRHSRRDHSPCGELPPYTRGEWMRSQALRRGLLRQEHCRKARSLECRFLVGCFTVTLRSLGAERRTCAQFERERQIEVAGFRYKEARGRFLPLVRDPTGFLIGSQC